MKWSVTMCLVCVLGLCLAPGPCPAEETTNRAAAAAGSNNAFAADLYGALRSEQGNLFFSPYSVWAAMNMVREGAGGETAAEMDRVLHAPSQRQGSVRALTDALTPRMVRDGWGETERRIPEYELNIANALWGQQGYAFKGPFLGVLETSYRAPLEQIDFRQTEAARQRINAWVAKQTRDRIRNIVPEGLPTPATRLVLANAIYFKGQWQHPFHERGTKDAPFYGAGGQTSAPFMRQMRRYAYAEVDGTQVLEIPYRGMRTSMVILLPRARDGLPALEKRFTAAALERWIGALRPHKVDLKLPRFEFTRPQDLTGVLPAMGMKRAFDGQQADFSGMTDQERLFIGAVLHKAFVSVDEKGTEAAAATVVMMKGGKRPQPEEPVVFQADHPFLFLIRHRPTGAILFMGRLTQPTQS